MTVAFLFPGQGADLARDLRSWYDRSAEVRRLVGIAAEAIPLPVERIVADRGRTIARTEVLQGVLTAVSLGIHAELAARGVQPGIVAGHSLGEIAAAAAAGCLSAADAVRLAAVRGSLMAREASRHPGGMLALNTQDPTVAEQAVRLGREHGLAAVAAHNAPDQWVVSGESAALRAIAGRFPTTSVPVAGPWHSSAMAGAVDEFRTAARAVMVRAPEIPLVCNRTGRLVNPEDDLPGLLAEQFINPIQWVASLGTLARLGGTSLVTIGPAKVLRGLARATLGLRVTLHAAEVPDDLDRLTEALAP